jgi:molybdopterin-guanine dinucleotide biosynthesis protein A
VQASGEALVAVLAGGASRRMGAPKPLAALGGRPLIAHPLAAAAAAGLRAVVVAKPDTPLPLLDVPVWLEPAEPRHPLVGLVTALERAAGPVVAVACDQPWLPPALLARLAAPGAARGLALALRVGDRPEPFPARYAPAALPVLRAALTAEAPVRRALAALEPELLDADAVRGLGDAADMVAGVNTPAALAEAERRLAAPPR